MSDLSEEIILTTFDKLVADGIIIYGSHDVVRKDCGGYPVRRYFLPSLPKYLNHYCY